MCSPTQPPDEPSQQAWFTTSFDSDEKKDGDKKEYDDKNIDGGRTTCKLSLA
jgi:hypothetical protein